MDSSTGNMANLRQAFLSRVTQNCHQKKTNQCIFTVPNAISSILSTRRRLQSDVLVTDQMTSNTKKVNKANDKVL